MYIKSRSERKVYGMQFYISPSRDAAWNLALEEVLWRSGEEVFLLWRNAPSVIVGRHQNALQEVNADFAREQGIAVVRRVTGGGAVYHDPGNINFSRTAASGIWHDGLAEKYLQPVLSALKTLGFDGCEFSGRNDLLYRGRKISGCARSVQLNRVLFHGTLLYDADLSVLDTVLTPDPEKIRSKGVRSVRARVGNLRELAGGLAPDPETFWQDFSGEIAQQFGMAGPVPIPEERLLQAEHLAETKYRTREWNWGTAFPWNLVRKKQFRSGWVTAEMQIRGHRMEKVRFSGDFFADRPVALLEMWLEGVVPEYPAILAKLREIEADDLISGVSAEELAELLALQKPPVQQGNL